MGKENVKCKALTPGEGTLCRRLEDGKLQCLACGHRCRIPEGREGICRVRFHEKGKLYVPWGYVAALQDDPIEKKPFFHVMPGARALSFGMLGCDFHCSYCQNWITSQAFRDPAAIAPIYPVTASKLVQLALQNQCEIVVSTYNEPLITSEWAVEIFQEAKKKGLVTGYVSNGNATPEVLDFIRPWVDLYKVDLKGFNDQHYRQLGGVLENVCQSIREIYQKGFWLEIVTLLVPGFNDSEEELRALTSFIASVSVDIPWHVTAFHRDYKMTDKRDTTAEDLQRACEIGRQAGLRYIYAGNLPGRTGRWENTYCHVCGTLLVERVGFQVLKDVLSSNQGLCPKCKTKIPGFWKAPQGKGPYERVGRIRPLF